ncbi:GH3 auxin-responsive promoter family protein [Raoultella terrigena]|uniref:GH3 family domain-containing protein n=1 Tax=Raoultella terrigena TaxID=577 RepID=UPI00349F3ECC
MINPWLHFQQTTSCPTGDVRERQTQWLLNCLNAHQFSVYGQKHGFCAITSVEEYQYSVPIVSYEDIAPHISRIAAGAVNELFCEEVLAFEKTGGSHSGGKLIPYTARGLADFRRALVGWLSETITQHQLTQGSAYWALSPAAAGSEFTTSGHIVGAGDALYLGEEHLVAFAQLSAVPLSLGLVEKTEEWQLLTLYFLIRHSDLRLISVWSPTFLTLLLTALWGRQQELLALLSSGGLIAGHVLEQDAEACERYRHSLQQQDTRLLWPELAVISCWADASSKTLADEMMSYFPSVSLQPKGLLSTEAVISVPVAMGGAALCVDSNFYEFLDDDGAISLADEVVEGGEYRVIVTTNSGLYRYQTGDRVRCIARFKEIPRLQFLGRSGVNSDLVGEKLSEPFVIRCLDILKGFAVLATDTRAPGYVLLLDAALSDHNAHSVGEIERRLCANPQYHYARRMRQLAPLRFMYIDNPADRYLRWRQQQGKRLGDIKIPVLLSTEAWPEAFQT